MDFRKLTDYQLNSAVAHALGWRTFPNDPVEKGMVYHIREKGENKTMRVKNFNPTKHPTQGFQLIEKYRISLVWMARGAWQASARTHDGLIVSSRNKNPLRAAMITLLKLVQNSYGRRMVRRNYVLNDRQTIEAELMRKDVQIAHLQNDVQQLKDALSYSEAFATQASFNHCS